MSNKMLIDAAHPEETRVVVLRGNKVEEFDFEAAERQQLRGNIYLAKVTRVEPSLQAAFVEYGGNRHGFLAFSEIHPDYYQIPYADRQVLLEEHARDEAEQAAAEEPAGEEDEGGEERADEEGGAPEGAEPAATGETEGAASVEQVATPDAVEQVGAEDALEELPQRQQQKSRARQYKIQEVIKRRQVLLVQVVKEERGNKGAALTTYLSLAGRYSVLMPNTARGGGISRKITNAADRKRLKGLAAELDVPEGMGVILRTAGANRTKAEIKRDFEYLLRLWENVRELTLRSTAPSLVYEEGSLIKRAIRDLYSREIDQVLVAGEEGYREAKDFMRMLMPSHAKNVQPYRDEVPIFMRHAVESQLDAMFSPQVRLRSGGYIVINQTEALVAIDVNSGKSTREHSIEDTALQTNLEAAEEVARQLRLRDLAGLIVIDFIDMEEKRNNRAVEKKLKDSLRFDRARIQLGRISHFGLLEMSRQRIRTGVLESSTEPCPVCHGVGQVRSISSLALQILRALEDALLRYSGHHLRVRTRPDTALYILNRKRAHLTQLEERFGLSITVLADAPAGGSAFSIERGEPVMEEEARRRHVALIDFADKPEAEEGEERPEADRRGANGHKPRGEDRQSGHRHAGRGAERHEARVTEPESEAEPDEAEPDEAEQDIPEERAGEGREAAGSEEGGRKRRRRGRRGGKRRRPEMEAGAAAAGHAEDEDAEFGGGSDTSAEAGPYETIESPESEPDRPSAESDAPAAPSAQAGRRGEAEDDRVTEARFRRESPDDVTAEREDQQAAATPEREARPQAEESTQETAPATQATENGAAGGHAGDGDEPDATIPSPATEQTGAAETRSEEPRTTVLAEEDDNRPKRTGWWQRRSFF